MTGIHGGLARRIAATTVAGLALSTAIVAGPAGAAPPEPAFPPKTDTSRPISVDQAVAGAMSSKAPVEATGAANATDKVMANPDGTLTLSRSTVPTRARVGGQWKDLDSSLSRNADGTLSPAVSAEPLRLSGGGVGPMAVMGGSGLSAALHAPMALPVPRILSESDDTAVYDDVLPGVDLQVKATKQGGFSEVFVVHTAAAAANVKLKNLTLPTQLTGVTLSADAAGNITGKDRIGRAVLTAPSPRMWDSTPTGAATFTDPEGTVRDVATGGLAASDARGPGAAARTAPVVTAVKGGAIELTPDRGLLTGTATRYPVYIDPTFTWSSAGSKNNGWATVAKNFPGTNYWKDTPDPLGRMQVGNPGEIWSRTFINFPIPVSTLSGATINTATMSITETRSWSCNPSRVNLYAPSATLSSSNATWNYWNGQSLGSVVDYKTVAHGYNSSCPAAGVSFNVKNTISADVAANKKTQTFALTGVDEQSDNNSWKEFLETSPTLHITYNHEPNKPTGLTTSPRTSCTASTPTIVGDGPVTLYAPVSDRNANTLGIAFKVWRTDTGATVANTTYTNTTYSSGTTAVYPIPVGALRAAAGGAAKTFGWSVQTSDFNLTSDVSDTCKFTFDPTRTGPPRVDPVPDGAAQIGQSVTISVQPPCAPNQPEQTPPACTLASPVPTSYLYQLNGLPAATVTATAGVASFTVSPTRFTNTVTVTGLSAGGNVGDTVAETFNATPAATAIDSDFDGDNVTDLVTAGGTNNLASGIWLATGKDTGALAPAAGNLGARGVGALGTGQPADFDGTQIITGRFAGSGLQDVLSYRKPDTTVPFGSAVLLRGNGDGSAIQAQFSGTTHSLGYPAFTDDQGTEPLMLANAGHQSSPNYPDLIGISGSAGGLSYLTYFASSDGIGYNGGTALASVSTPTGGVDWDTWTITSATTDTGTAMFLWHAGSGKLYLWNNLVWVNSALSYTQHELSPNWNTGQSITPRAADINRDGTVDLWSVGANAMATAWLTSNLNGATGTVTAQPAQKVLTGTHAWMLNDPAGGDLTSSVTPQDSIGTLHAAGAGGAKWSSGNLFSPDVEFNGTSATLTTTAPAVATNADFTVSAWVQAPATGGTVLSQDGSNTAAFRVWADPSNFSWRFAMAASNSATTAWTVASTPAGKFKPGAWTQVSASYKASTGVMDLHIDGRDYATATHLNPWSATGAFRIGAYRNTSSSVSGYLTGQVAEVATYNQVVIYDLGNNAVWDFDGDLKPDIMAIDSAGALFLYRGNGAGGFRSGGGARIGTGWNGYNTALTVKDFDGDALPDVIARTSSGQLFLHRGNGAGAWASGAGITLGTGWGGYNALFSPGDFDGDNNTDVIGRTTDGKLNLHRGNGTGGWLTSSGTEIGTGWGGYNHTFSNGDFTGDANPDVIGREPNGDLYIFRGNGTGAWQSGQRTKIGTGWHVFVRIF